MPARKKLKEILPPPSSAFLGVQLLLFKTFLCNTHEERDKLSNTIELWDGVPKYFISRKEMNNLRKEGFLPTLERDFQYNKRTLTVKIRPARLTDEVGKDKEFYPSAREELVEDALRKIAVEQNHGFFQAHPEPTDRRSGVVFSLYMLRRELKRRGHSLSYQEVMEALDIMSSAVVELSTADGHSLIKSPILPALAGVSRADLKKDPRARWLAHFCPLVTESIHAMTYRQFDYHTMMSNSAQLTRWLHKRLAHNYSNAHVINPYSIWFSSIQRDSGLLDYKVRRRAVQKLEESLEELISNKMLLSFAILEEKRGARNRILDIKYTLTPHPDFVKLVKAANKRVLDNQRQLQNVS